MELTSGTSHVVADDGARLAVHLTDPTGPLLIVLPGGPMLSAAYLADLGGLAADRQLALLDSRGNGSEAPADPSGYRCDALVADVEAVRRHLDVERVDLLAHSGGANLAYRYAEHHPERVGRLVLVTPSVFGVGIEISAAQRRAVLDARAGEPWYEQAAAAFEAIQSGTTTDDTWAALDPVSHGRWDDDTRAYAAGMDAERNVEAEDGFVAEGAFDPPRTRAALAVLDVPVLVLAGGVDVGNPTDAMAQVADLFPQGRLVVQEGAGHFPWHDDPAAFCELACAFLDAPG